MVKDVAGGLELKVWQVVGVRLLCLLDDLIDSVEWQVRIQKQVLGFLPPPLGNYNREISFYRGEAEQGVGVVRVEYRPLMGGKDYTVSGVGPECHILEPLTDRFEDDEKILFFHLKTGYPLD